jgi:ribose/xylose/arabinose/galactoside ABC-type transport system permease subunit
MTSVMTRCFARRETGVAFVLALTLAVVGFVRPAFLSAPNLRDVLVQCVPALIIGGGLTLVIAVGEIDISVGSLTGLLAAVAGTLTSPQRLGLPVGPGVALTLLLGAGVGCLNGLLVTVGRAPSIVVTLGMLTALRGVTELLMAGEWITELPSALRFAGTGSWAGVRVSLWVAALSLLGAAFIARQTPLGRRLYAVGSNPRAARLAGLSVARAKLAAFTLTGLLVGVATLVSVPQLSVIESGIGTGLELFVVTAVVVGGASISGGKGTILGTVLGVVLLGIVRTVLIFLDLGERAVYWERAIQGGFILLAVLADHVARHRHAAGHPP